jgi:hypothetical protein
MLYRITTALISGVIIMQRQKRRSAAQHTERFLFLYL